MKTRTESDVKHDLEQAVRTIKSLLSELDPAERLRFVNETFLRLMPDRKQVSSAAEKIKSGRKTPKGDLTDAQMKLIKTLSDKTDDLFDIDGGDHRA
ncbi:MAG: hypothetical protein U0Y08_09240 [Bacteroidia bacterium]